MPALDHHDPDTPLIARLVAGDAEALAELRQRHDRWVRGAIYTVLGRCDEMDDVAQHVWLNAWQQASRLENAERWRPWLYR
ncbi:MAG: RNA polymerase sigma factor, partial [Planctomycetota bacterium]